MAATSLGFLQTMVLPWQSMGRPFFLSTTTMLRTRQRNVRLTAVAIMLGRGAASLTFMAIPSGTRTLAANRLTTACMAHRIIQVVHQATRQSSALRMMAILSMAVTCLSLLLALLLLCSMHVVVMATLLQEQMSTVSTLPSTTTTRRSLTRRAQVEPCVLQAIHTKRARQGRFNASRLTLRSQKARLPC